jgi:hypothetical protein
MSNASTINWDAIHSALSGNSTGQSFVNDSAVAERTRQVNSELELIHRIKAEQVARKKQNENSWVNKLGLDPNSGLGQTVNLGASFVSGASRVAGHVTALPAYLSASHDGAQLTDKHYEAYARHLKGQATPEDNLRLQSKTHMDDRTDNPTILQSIESQQRKQELGRDIVERFDISNIVQQDNRTGLAGDLKDGFAQPWDQVKEGWGQLKEGQDGEGWSNLASGAGKLLANAFEAVGDNKMGALEYVVENVPQLALGAFGKAGMGALTASNVGYAADEYQKGLEKYRKENGGAMPPEELRERMATHAMSLALAEQVGDVSLLKGIGKIAGTTDDAVKTGFKQALKGYAGAVGKGTVSESITEGWQTYAEGEANLTPAKAEDIYVGSVIGGVAGGGMTAASPAIAAVGAAKDLAQGYKAVRQEAQAELAKLAEAEKQIEEAKASGNVDVFLDRNNKQMYDPSKAMQVLFEQDTSNFTEEQSVAHQEKVKQVINSFEREVAVLNSAMQTGNSAALQAEIAELKQEAQEYPDDPTIAEDIAMLEAKAKEPALPEAERQAYQEKLDAITPKLEQARKVYEQMLNVKTGKLEEGTNVDQVIEEVKVATDSNAVKGSVDKIRILSMASPGAVTTQQAQSLLNSGKLSEEDSQYFKLYINAEQSVDKAKSMSKVAKEVLEGDDALNQKGLETYKTRFAQYLSDGNKAMARREMSGLMRFIDSHTSKFEAMTTAFEEAKQTGLNYHIFKDESGQWQSKEIPTNAKSFKRKKGEYIIGNASQQLLIAVDQEIKAMGDTMALLDHQISNSSQGVSNVSGNTTINTTDSSITAPIINEVQSVQTDAGIQQSSETSFLEGNEVSTVSNATNIPNTPVQTEVTGNTDTNPADNIPRVQVGQDPDGWLNQNAQLARTQSDNAGLTAEIEGYFAQGMTAQEALNEVKDRLTFVDPLEQKNWIVGVRATLGIPSKMDADGQVEFAQWQNEYNQRQANKLKNAQQFSTNQTQPTIAPETAATTEVVQETTEAGTVTESTDAPVSNQPEAVSTEGNTEQSVEENGVVEAEVQEDTESTLSVFRSEDPNLAIARNGLKQSAGRDNGTKRPLVKVRNFLSALVAGTESASSYLKDALTPTQEQTLARFMKTAQKWNKAIDGILPTKLNTGFAWENPAAYLMTVTDGKVSFDENTKTAMSAAAMAWAADFYRQGLYNRDEVINQLLGREPEHEVTDVERSLLAGAGVRRAAAANALGRRIVESLGLKANKTAPQNLLVKIEASLGTYALAMLVNQGVLEYNQSIDAQTWADLTGNPISENSSEFTTQEFVRLGRNPNNTSEVNEQVKWLLDTVKGSQNVIEKLFSVEDGATFPTLEPVEYSQKTVQKGWTRIPKKLAEVLKKKNQEPNYLRTRMYEIMSVMAPEAFLQMAGVKSVEDYTLHINNRRSQEAKNDGLIRDYWNIREFVESTWEEAGLEMPVFLQHVAWKNQRVGIENIVLNPQTSKIARHLLKRKSWETQVDPTNQESFDNFRLRVLEGFGVKTDKQNNTKSLQQWSLVEGEGVQAAVNALVFLRTNPGTELSPEQQKAIVDAVAAGGENMKTLDSLNALVDLRMSENKPFTTELVGEVDGVTNGPMLTNLLMGAAYTAQELFSLINKGGFFQLGSGFQNYNIFRGSNGAMDLYEGTTKAVLDKVRHRLNSSKMNAIWAFTEAMEDKEGKVVKPGRDIIKRPITALHFGSATKKAVDGMADDFVKAVFRQIEKYNAKGRDVTPLVKHLNSMLGGKPIPENITAEALMNWEFKRQHIKALKEHFIDALGKPTEEVLNTSFAETMERKRAMNGMAGLMFGMYNSVYQTLRNEYIAELVEQGVIEAGKTGIPRWDLSQEQEAEFAKRFSKIKPLLATAMSTASGEKASGLSVSKSSLKLSNNAALHNSRVKFNKATVGQGEMSINGQVLVEEGPGVASFSVSIHSFDSAVSHMAAILSEALNIHDAHVTGLGNFKEVAQNLNKALWDMALSYSPMNAMYESAANQAVAMYNLLSDPNTPPSARTALRNYLQSEIEKHNEKEAKKKTGVLYTGSLGGFVLMKLQELKAEAHAADKVRLGALAEMAFIDQYALEGGQHEVTENDRAQARNALSKLDSSLSASLVQAVQEIDVLLSAAPKRATEFKAEPDPYADEHQGVQETLGASNAEVQILLNTAAQSNELPGTLQNTLQTVDSLVQNQGMSVDQALQATGASTSEKTAVVSVLGKVQQAAQSTPFGVLGTPAVVPEADVVAMMEVNPEMTGQEAVKKLWSVLSKRGDSPQKAFYGKLLMMASKALGDNIKVKYITPSTAPDEVLASPTIASRGWYVANNGTIYVLSPDFAASGLTAEVLVHELVHAAIEHLIENPGTAAQKQAVQELEGLLEAAQKYAQANNITKFSDALSGVQELVAWGMTNADFQAEILNRITVPESAQSNRVVKGLKKFIDSLVKLVFPDMAKGDKGTVNGFAALVGNTTALFKQAAQQQEKKIKKAVESVNRIHSMATPSPNQIDTFTTEQVFDALGTLGNNSQAFEAQLQERLSEVVNALHGPFGAIKAQIEQRVGNTALDAWANALARNERPFHGKVLNAKVAMTAQEGFVAEQIEAVMGEVLQEKNASNSMIYKELEKVFLAAQQELKGKIDPDLYNFVFRPQKDQGNRSDYMARFVALTLANEGFNKSMGFATSRADLNLKGKTFSERIEILWRAAVDWLSAQMTGTFLGQSANKRTEALVRKLVQIEARNKDKVRSKYSVLEFMDPIMNRAKDGVDAVREGVIKGANSSFVRQNRLMVVQTAGKLVTTAMRIDKVADGINAFRNQAIKNKHGQAMQLMNYIRGPGQWLNAMAREATRIQGERKHLIHDTSKAVLAAFKDGGAYLGKEAKRAVAAYLLRTGAFVLLDKYDSVAIQNMLENKAELDKAIQTEIGLLASYPEVHYYIAQAKGLAWKQVTGWAGVEEQNLNAHNIAKLFNTGYPSPAHAKDTIPAIEKLIALYGLQYAKEEDSLGVSHLLEVMRTENERGADNGIFMALATHRFLTKQAKETIFKESEALMMHGYLPEVHNPHITFKVVRDDIEEQAVIDAGYSYEMEIALDPNDPDKRPAKMYVLKGGGLPRWASGAFSTRGTNARGKSKHSNYYNPFDADGVKNDQSMMDIHASKTGSVNAQFLPNPGFKPDRRENRLVPLLNANGHKVDYRYTMKETFRDKILERNNDFDHLLGVLAGGTYDKEASAEQNKKLVQALHGMYTKDYAKNPHGYVLVGYKSTDPELREIWDLLGSTTKLDIQRQWGMKGMMVPKEMVTPLFGYRKATLSSLFDKENRNMVEDAFVDTATLFMKMYGRGIKRMTTAQAEQYSKQTYLAVRKGEDVWEEIVSEMKNTIVIKTFTVLWGNMTSNFSVLLMNGLSLKDIVLYQKEALNAVMDYQRDRDALAQLELRLNTAMGLVDEEALRAEMVRLQDSLDRNPAKELIDAGLLPTIVEDVFMEDDPYSYKSHFAQWIDEKAKTLNPAVVNAGRVVYMTHDTTLYKFLNKSTQYSDFIGRYALYKHETTRKRNPLSKEQALFNASESFVNYDIPMPKVLQYLDDHGLMMFTKYFLSIQRVLARLVTEKPLEVMNTIALNNWLFDLPILTDTAAITRIGNNPLSMGALGFPGTLDDLATVNSAMSLMK